VGAGLLSDELINLLGCVLAGTQSTPPESHIQHLLRELRSDPTLHRPLNLRAHVQHAMKDEAHMTVSTVLIVWNDAWSHEVLPDTMTGYWHSKTSAIYYQLTHSYLQEGGWLYQTPRQSAYEQD
jgi:hypothetical protein